MDVERFEDARARLQARLKPSRYLHSLGVSQTAEQLARIYGVDCDDAAIAGLLHDWDKALPAKELRRICKKEGLAPKFVRKHVDGVLHSFTAPLSLRREFPWLSDGQLQAVARHTCAAVDMTPLDMVVFVADAIEPGRDFEGVDALRGIVGEVGLDELFERAFASSMVNLIESGRTVYPGSLEVWNSLVLKRSALSSEDGSAPYHEKEGR